MNRASDPIRVLHVTPRLTRAAGGAWHYIEGLTRNLERVGVRCTVAGVVERGSVDYQTLQVTRVITGEPTLLSANYGASVGLRRALRHDVRDIDLVHAHGFRVFTDGPAAAFARKHAIPLVLSPHGQLNRSIAGNRSLKGRFHRAFLGGGELLRVATCGLAVGDAEVADLQAALPGRPVTSLPIGVDLDTYRVGKTGYLARVAPKSAGKRTLLYLAYMHPNKGLARLADAWLRMHRERPEWHLVLAGVDINGLGAASAQRLHASGAGDSFTLLGPVYGQDQRDLFADADLFTMPSDGESFGIAFAESLASGVPVIATRGAPWSSLVERNCGWWIEPTVDALAETILTATALSDDERRSMGERGRQLVAERFDWLAIAAKMRALYESLLHRGGTEARS